MMADKRGARDRRFEKAVEGDGASGAASPFDGNLTCDIVSWLFADEDFYLNFSSRTLEKLMWHTERGHLAWVLFPPEGFRL